MATQKNAPGGESAPIPNDTLKPGDLFMEEYRIVGVLGRGGMGVVYEAVEDETGDEVAIKCLLPCHADREDYLVRFKQEYRIYPKLKHPNIVRMHRAGVSPLPFIVMERLRGRTLRRLLERYFRLDFLNAVHVMIQIADAMRFAHSKGIMHRDLKPENTMVGTELDDKGRVWLLDFGIAKVADGKMNTEDMPDLGTARYMAPEQVRNILGAARKGQRVKLDGRIDIYAFGVMFYEVITGKHHFIDDDDPPTFEETLAGHLHADPQPVHEIVPDCPESVWPIIARCIAIDREARYPTFDELCLDLRALIRESVPPEHPLARRVAQERTRNHRQVAFSMLPLDPPDEAEQRVAIPPEPPRPVEPRAATPERPVATKPVLCVTAPLDELIPPRSPLPFVSATPAPPAPPRDRGRGFTIRMPIAHPRPQFPSGGFFPTQELPVAASPPPRETPPGRTTPPAPPAMKTGLRRSTRLLLLAPLVGLTITLAGTVVVLADRPWSRSPPGLPSAEPAASSSMQPPAAPPPPASADLPAVVPGPPEPTPAVKPTPKPPRTSSPPARLAPTKTFKPLFIIN